MKTNRLQPSGLKIMFLTIVLLGLIILGLSSVSAYSICYQETANVSTDCGGLSSGGYVNAVTGNAMNNFPYISDGNWNTGSYMDVFSSSGSVKINYKVNTTLFYNGLWKINDSKGLANINLPYGCVLSEFNSNLNLTLNISADPMNVTYYCWNADTGKLVALADRSLASSADFYVYEEAVLWNGLPLENSQTYNPTTYETSLESFSINITYDSEVYTLSSASLIYNGISYLATKIGTGNTVIFNKQLSIPLGNETKSFYWNISLTGGTTTTLYQSANYTQTVLPLNITSCSSGNITLNFTAYDEQTLARINPFVLQGTFYVWLGDGTIVKNISLTNSTNNENKLCLNVNRTVYSNAIIQYTDVASNYVSRNYYLINASLTNITQSISLYLLNKSAPSSSFIMNVYDSNALPDPNVYIYTQRYYPGENLYRTVQMSHTDAQGQTVGFFQQEIPDYKFILVKDGQVLLETTSQKMVAQVSPYTINFNLGNTLVAPWQPFQNVSSLQYLFEFNKTNNLATFSYIDTSGTLHYGRLYIQRVNYTGNNAVICDVNSTSASATLVCNMTGYEGGFQGTVSISRSPELPVKVIMFTVHALSQVLGSMGTFLAWLIILSVAMVGIYNPTTGIIMVNVAVIFVNILGLVSFGAVFIIGCIAISIFIIAELNT